METPCYKKTYIWNFRNITKAHTQVESRCVTVANTAKGQVTMLLSKHFWVFFNTAESQRPWTMCLDKFHNNHYLLYSEKKSVV